MTHCNIIRDLLPLYVDGVCSVESRELVEDHLARCPACARLHGEMTGKLPGEAEPADLTEKKLFQSLRWTLLGIILAAAAMISCFVINAGGAWMGGPASLGQLAVTVLYIVFWGVFSVASRRFAPLVKVSFVISLLTFIAAANSLVQVLMGNGGFLSAFISVFASVPLYGLRYLMDWTGLYVVAAALSLGWLVYTGYHLRRIKRQGV